MKPISLSDCLSQFLRFKPHFSDVVRERTIEKRVRVFGAGFAEIPRTEKMSGESQFGPRTS